MLLTKIINLILVLYIALFNYACGDISYPAYVKYGDNIDTTPLISQLVVGSSTEKDVLTLLGEPNGKGKTMLPIDEEERNLWSYYFQEDIISFGRAESVQHLKMLFVYFKDGVYDGHLWFATFDQQ